MSTFQWVAIALITITSASRLTRLATYDKFPPVRWLRDKFADWTDTTPRRRSWQLIAFCAYCFSYWPTLAIILTGYYSHWHDAWWIVNGSLGASYLAAILMIHDGEPEDEDSD